jgi:hypothetical protein
MRFLISVATRSSPRYPSAALFAIAVVDPINPARRRVGDI